MTEESKKFSNEEEKNRISSEIDDIIGEVGEEKKQEFLKVKEEMIVFLERLDKETKKKEKELLQTLLLAVKQGDAIGEKSILLMWLTKRFGGVPLNYMKALDEIEYDKVFELIDKVVEAKTLADVFKVEH